MILKIGQKLKVCENDNSPFCGKVGKVVEIVKIFENKDKYLITLSFSPDDKDCVQFWEYELEPFYPTR